MFSLSNNFIFVSQKFLIWHFPSCISKCFSMYMRTSSFHPYHNSPAAPAESRCFTGSFSLQAYVCYKLRKQHRKSSLDNLFLFSKGKKQVNIFWLSYPPILPPRETHSIASSLKAHPNFFDSSHQNKAPASEPLA